VEIAALFCPVIVIEAKYEKVVLRNIKKCMFKGPWL
jgi:hypothetical protein